MGLTRQTFRGVGGILLFLLVAAGMAGDAGANNAALSSVSLLAQSGGARTIQFTASWDNSWFVSGAPGPDANWDALWVFAKFRRNTGLGWSDWAHCTLSRTAGDHTAPSGFQITVGCSPSAACGGGDTGKGIFLYRNAAGNGTATAASAGIKWLYSTDGVSNSDGVDIRIFAVEMVYVPQGSFFTGDPSQTGTDPFYSYGCSAPNCAYQVTSEGAITVGTTNGNLYYTNSSGLAGDRGTPVPAAFPKGYNAFYIMKTEVSQKQYAGFLNTLTPGQQAARWVMGYFNSSRFFIKKSADGRFGTDGNNNAGADGSAAYASLNEADDGGGTAANYLSYMDGAAYAAWAALRPLTELEFEKAARGDQPAVAGEYAWGTTSITPPSSGTPSNNRTVSETANTGNCNYNNVILGPLRVGAYAGAGTSRENAGAGYYGALDLSGSLWDRPVTVGNAAGRAFTGTHGSGALSANGNATNSDWPGINSGEVTGATGAGIRGGTWSHGASYARVSDRYYAAGDNTDRYVYNGARCARTSP